MHGAPQHFCVSVFGVIFLRENVNLMYFVCDVVIESLVVTRLESISVREAVNFLFFRREFVKQA